MGTLNKQFSKKDIIIALKLCGDEHGCQKCPLNGIADCMNVRNDNAIKFIEENINESNNPLSLNELIEIMQKERPVWIEGYGWFFIKEIIIDKLSTKIYTHTNNNFVFREQEDRFYRKEIIK